MPNRHVNLPSIRLFHVFAQETEIIINGVPFSGHLYTALIINPYILIALDKIPWGEKEESDANRKEKL